MGTIDRPKKRNGQRDGEPTLSGITPNFSCSANFFAIRVPRPLTGQEDEWRAIVATWWWSEGRFGALTNADAAVGWGALIPWAVRWTRARATSSSWLSCKLHGAGMERECR